MCILCDNKNLELLSLPLDRLAPGQLAQAIHAAREAAEVGILDHAEAVLRGEAPPEVGAELYGDVVVERALEAGVLSRADAYQWEARLARATGALDPRVQAFVSSGWEIVDDYRVLVDARQQVIGRFVEAPPEAIRFAWLGDDGELWFEHREEDYAALSQAEAMDIVEREVEQTLHSLHPEELLRYTSLPDSGVEVLTAIQAREAASANDILAGLINVSALADDRVRAVGYAPFFKGEPDQVIEAIPFGEWVLLRRPVI